MSRSPDIWSTKENISLQRITLFSTPSVFEWNSPKQMSLEPLTAATVQNNRAAASQAESKDSLSALDSPTARNMLFNHPCSGPLPHRTRFDPLEPWSQLRREDHQPFLCDYYAYLQPSNDEAVKAEIEKIEEEIKIEADMKIPDQILDQNVVMMGGGDMEVLSRPPFSYSEQTAKLPDNVENENYVLFHNQIPFIYRCSPLTDGQNADTNCVPMFEISSLCPIRRHSFPSLYATPSTAPYTLRCGRDYAQADHEYEDALKLLKHLQSVQTHAKGCPTSEGFSQAMEKKIRQAGKAAYLAYEKVVSAGDRLDKCHQLVDVKGNFRSLLDEKVLHSARKAWKVERRAAYRRNEERSAEQSRWMAEMRRRRLQAKLQRKQHRAEAREMRSLCNRVEKLGRPDEPEKK
ncbi:hypothetical protein MMC20_002650 [Loxospora ochrophaea]|nr:hypothetical protein [Loxospora ochrophaea]